MLKFIEDNWPHFVAWTFTLIIYVSIISKQYGRTKGMIENLQGQVAKLETQLEKIREGGPPLLCKLHEARLDAFEATSNRIAELAKIDIALLREELRTVSTLIKNLNK